MHLGRRMVRTEVVRVRVDPPLPKRLELFPPDHDLLVVFGHAAEVSETECVYWLPGGGSNNMIWGARPVLGRCAPCALPMPPDQRPRGSTARSSSALALGLRHGGGRGSGRTVGSGRAGRGLTIDVALTVAARRAATLVGAAGAVPLRGASVLEWDAGCVSASAMADGERQPVALAAVLAVREALT